MSAGLSHLSDADLMRMLGQSAPPPAEGRATTAPPSPDALSIRVRPSNSVQPAPADLSHLSDDDLMRQLAPSGFSPEPASAAPASFAQRFEGDGSIPQRFSGEPAPSSGLGNVLQAKADEALIGKPSAGNDALSALFGAGQAASLNLAGNASAGLATLMGKAGVPGYSPRSFSENYARFKDLQDALGRQSPKSALGGTVAGALLSAPLMPGLAGAPAAKFGARMGQYALTAGGYGAASELADSKSLGRAAGTGFAGAAVGGPLGSAVEKIAPPVVAAASRVLAPLAERVGFQISRPSGGFSVEAQSALRAAGLDPLALPPELASQLQATFKAKGVGPASIREAQAAEFGIPLSQGQATRSAADILRERLFLAGSKGTGAQQAGQGFLDRQRGAVLDARTIITQALAGKRATIDNPVTAGEGVADVARRLSDETALRSATAQRGADQALEAVRGRGGTADPIEAATQAGQAVREAASQGRAAYRGAYDEVAQIPGTFTAGALDRMGTRVRDRLGADVPIDNVLTPSASRALADLDNLPGIFGIEPRTGPNLQQVDQLRKRLVAYRGATAQNPTDRRAMDRILREFDAHVNDAMDLGQFGRRAAPSAAAPAPVDDFPGLPVGGAFDPVGTGSRRLPETMGQFIARNGGLELSGDARAADFHRWQVGGLRPLAREGGQSVDALRDKLVVAGFLRPDDESGAIARDITDEVMDALHAERAGRPRYRFEDEGRASAAGREAEHAAAENADHAAMLDRQARRMTIDLEGYGLRPQDLDRDTLHDAAGMMLRRETDDAAEAWDRAVARRPEAPENGAPPPAGGEDVPFPELGERAAAANASGFPAGDTAPAEALRNARGLFSQYKRTFAPRGASDDVGLALRKVVEREATPNEIAAMLYGGTRPGSSGLSVRIHDRLTEALGADHPALGAIRQGLISKVIDGGPGDVVSRLDHLLNGEGRTLAARVLTPEQRSGLEAFRVGSIRARNAQDSLPEWVRRLADTGFDPNRVTADLFGSGVPGARPGQADFARGLRTILGPDSAEWANLRQAAWLRLVQHGEVHPIQPAREAARIRAFTEGEGRGLATTMFTADEIATMNRYADAVKATDIPRGGRLPDGGRAARMASHFLNGLAGAVGFKVAGPAGAGAAYGLKLGQRALQGGLSSAQAARTFNGGAPRTPAPMPAYAPALGFGTAGGVGLLGAAAVPSGR